MAGELQYLGREDQTGLTVTAVLTDDTGATINAVSAPEVGTSAVYVADMPGGISAGNYGIRFFAGVEVLGAGFIDWDGTAEVTNQTIDAQVLSAAAGTVTGVTTLLPAAVYAEFITDSNEDVFKADISTLPTLVEMEASSALTAVADVSGLATSAELTQTETDIIAALPAEAPTPAAIYAEFISGGNEDAFKADISTLPTLAEMEASAALTAIADVSGLATSAELAQTETDIIASVSQTEVDIIAALPAEAPTPSDIYTFFTSGNNEDAFKADVSGVGGSGPTAAEIADAVWDEPLADHTIAGSTGEALDDADVVADVSGLATSAELAQAETDIIDAVNAASPTIDLSPVLSAIAALNDLSEAQVNAQVDAGIADAALATSAELAQTETDIIDALNGASVDLTPVLNALSALNDVSTAEVQTAVQAGIVAQDVATETSLVSGFTLLSNDIADDTNSVLAAITALNDLSQADVQAALTSQGYTAARAILLDNLDVAVSTLATAVQVTDQQAVTDLIVKILRNRFEINETTGVATIYDDDSVTPLLTGQVFEDSGGVQTYRDQGSNRRNRFA